MKASQKKVIENVLLCMAALFLSILLAEVSLRAFYPQNLNIVRLDEVKVFEHKPGIESVLARNEFRTHVTISSQGLRDREFTLQKPNDTLRIAVMGDSFVFGFGVEQDETFPKVLESLLNNHSKKNMRYEVMNFGVSAYGTEQEYLFLEDTVLKFSPDMVILSFFPNDFGENVKYGLFSIQGNSLLRMPEREIGWSLKLRNLLSWHSHLYSLFYFSVIDNKGLSDVLMKAHLLNSPIKEPQADFSTLIYTADSPEYNDALKKTMLLLEVMNRKLKEKDIEFIVFMSPTKEQVDEGMMQKLIMQKGLNESLNKTKTQEDVIPNLHSQGIAVIDPLVEFRMENRNNTFYFEIDGHWNSKGHELVAQILYRELSQRKMIG